MKNQRVKAGCIKVFNSQNQQEIQEKIDLFNGQNHIGRADFVVAKNSSVSSEHGIITFKNNQITIQDHKSRNGIAINIKANRLMKGKQFPIDQKDIFYIADKKCQIEIVKQSQTSEQQKEKVKPDLLKQILTDLSEDEQKQEIPLPPKKQEKIVKNNQVKEKKTKKENKVSKPKTETIQQKKKPEEKEKIKKKTQNEKEKVKKTSLNKIKEKKQQASEESKLIKEQQLDKGQTKKKQTTSTRVLQKKKRPPAESLERQIRDSPFLRSSISKQKKIIVSGFTPSISRKYFQIAEGVQQQFEFLVMKQYLRTFKALIAISKGIYIIRDDWLTDSEMYGKIKSQSRYYFKKMEYIYSAIEKVKSGIKVFEGLSFFLASNQYHLPLENIQMLVYLCGGQIIKKIGKLNSKDKNKDKKVAILRKQNSQINLDEVKKLKKEGYQKVYTIELILDSCERQQINWSKNLLSQ